MVSDMSFKRSDIYLRFVWPSGLSLVLAAMLLCKDGANGCAQSDRKHEEHD
jgi:hypothetical protein